MNRSHVASLLREMEARWRAGQPWSAQTILTQQTVTLTPEELLELVCQEIILTEQAGLAVHLADLLQQYPTIAEPLQIQWELDHHLRGETLPPASDSATSKAVPLATPVERADEVLVLLDPPIDAAELGRLGHYRVQRVLGSGGMGVVVAAYDEHLQRTVALKIMRPQFATEAEAQTRFLREARAMAALSHDHIVTIYEVATTHGVPFIAMQLLVGETLQERLQRTRLLSSLELLPIVLGMAQGLAAAHQAGLIHRDIKPANVWLEPSGRVKLLDFGLVRPQQSSASHSRLGALVGTPEYMAPEQIDGRPVDHRCDLFSLGCLCYRALSGTLPFQGVSLVETLQAVAHAEPVDLATLVPDVTPVLLQLTRQLLQKNPASRPANAQAIVTLLLEHYRDPWRDIDSPASKALPVVSSKSRVTRRWKAMALGLGALLLVVSVIGLGTIMVAAMKPTSSAPVTHKPEPQLAKRVRGLSPLVTPDDVAPYLNPQSQEQVALEAASIPAQDRLPVMPPQLVGILGSPRGKWGVTDARTTVAFDPTGRWLVRTSNYQLTIWDTTNLRPVVLDTFAETAGCLAISADGRWLATIVRPHNVAHNVILVYDLTSKHPPVVVHKLPALTNDPFTTLAFAGKTALVCGSQQGRVAVWNFVKATATAEYLVQHGEPIGVVAANADGTLVAALRRHEDTPRGECVCWERQGDQWQLLGVVTKNGIAEHGLRVLETRVYAVEEAEAKAQLTCWTHTDQGFRHVVRVPCLPPLKLLPETTGASLPLQVADKIELWSPQTLTKERTLPHGTLALGHDGQTTLACDSDGSLRLSSHRDIPPAPICAAWTHEQPVLGSHFALTFAAGQWHYWDFGAPRPEKIVLPIQMSVRRGALSRDGSHLAVIERPTGTIHFYQRQGSSLTKIPITLPVPATEPDRQFVNLEWMSTNHALITRRHDGTIEQWQLAPPTPIATKIATLMPSNHPVHLALNPAGTVVVALGLDGLHGWNLRDEAIAEHRLNNLKPGPMGFMNLGQELLVASLGPPGGIYRLDLRQRNASPQLLIPQPHYKLCVAPDGQYAFVVRPEYDSMECWHLPTAKRAFAWQPPGGIDSLHFTSTGTHGMVCVAGVGYVFQMPKP